LNRRLLNGRWDGWWNISLRALAGQPVLGVISCGESGSAHPHVDGGSPFPEGYFTFCVGFLFGNSRREDIFVVLDKIDEEHCRVAILD
jgi:hypothetical protein